MRLTNIIILSLTLGAACSQPERRVIPAPAKVAPAPQPQSEEDDLPIGRLPSDATPREYFVHLTIDPNQKTFSGDVAIAVTLARATDHVWLHGQGLRMKQTQVTLADGKVIAAHWNQMTPFGLVRLDFSEPIAAQDVRLLFSYDADFQDTANGLFRVTTETPYAFAQFEAVSARMCFPSFDEPRFKTPFAIAVTAPKDMQVVSTTHVIGTNDSDAPQEFRLGVLARDMTRTRFALTPPLPTYLLTFAVGHFDIVDHGPLPANAVRKQSLPFRGVAPRGQGKQLATAMSTLTPILNELEAYFGTPYPFDKLDIVAIPGFAGAMENAGAITFSDGILLMDPGNPSVSQRRNVANTIAHELAHMWFGDTVTMQWWDDLWLNEAFATWMQRRISQKVDPKLEAEVSGVEAVLRAMDVDALASARQIHQAVETTHEIVNTFDAITYSKGMGVLTMVEEYAGADRLREAVRAYVRDYRFANATADDFFAHLEAAAPGASTVLRSFTEQSGVPLVDAQLTCNGGAPATLKLSQDRYLPIGSTGETERRWTIPVCARYAIGKESTKTCWLLDAPSRTVELDVPGCPRWLTPNAGGQGYYRFTMSSQSLHGLLAALNAKELTRSEEITLFQTLRASVRAGRTPPSDLFKALPSFVARQDDKLDDFVIALYLDVQSQLVDPATVKAVDDHLQTLFSKRALKDPFVAKPKETDDERLARIALARVLSIEIDDSPQRRAAAKRGPMALEAIEQGRPVTNVDQLLLGVVLAVTMDDGGATVHERVVKALANESDPTIRRELVTALGSVRTGDSIKRTLAAMLTPAFRSKEMWIVSSMMRRKTSRQQTWDWLRTNFAAIREKIPADEQGYLVSLGHFFCSAEGERELGDFFEPRLGQLMGGEQIYAEARESIQLCAARAAALGDSVRTFFMADDITHTK